jgi:hypothetical protein
LLWYFPPPATASTAALESDMGTMIRALISTPNEKAYTYTLIDAAIRTHQAVASVGKARLT